MIHSRWQGEGTANFQILKLEPIDAAGQFWWFTLSYLRILLLSEGCEQTERSRQPRLPCVPQSAPSRKGALHQQPKRLRRRQASAQHEGYFIKILHRYQLSGWICKDSMKFRKGKIINMQFSALQVRQLVGLRVERNQHAESAVSFFKVKEKLHQQDCLPLGPLK